MILVLTILAGTSFGELKNDQKTKPSAKNDQREVKNPNEDRTVKITTIKKSRMLSVIHIVGVEVCAGKEKIYSPELNLRSDRESMTVKVSGLIMPKMCKNAEFFMRANDPDTISVSFSKPVYYVNQG